MHMQGFSFLEREQKSFISYSHADGETFLKTELEMLKNNDIHGILPVSEIHENDSVTLLYDVTSKQQFSQRMMGVFNGTQFYSMFKSIFKTLSLMEEYMLDCTHLIFNLDFIYYDYVKDEVQFVVLPLKNNGNAADLHGFLVNISRCLMYSDEILPDFPGYIYEYINNNLQIDIKKFIGYLENTYNSLRGIIQPVETAPPVPTASTSTEKEIIDTEEVKKNVQSRFINQNERIVEFESMAGIDFMDSTQDNAAQVKNKSVQTVHVPPGGFSVPSPKGGAVPLPPKKEKKIKEKRVKEKTAKKIKEKPVKKEKEKIPEKEKPENNVKETDLNRPKEKKGLFGFRKKEKKEDKKNENVPQPPAPPQVIQPVDNNNNLRMKLQNTPPYANSMQGMPPYKNSIQNTPVYTDGIQGTPSYTNGVQGRPQYIQGVQGSQAQWQKPFSANLQGTPANNGAQPYFNNIYGGQDGSPAASWTIPQNMSVQGKESAPVKSREFTGGFDPDATMLMDNGIPDLDSTVLLDTGVVMERPALRSRITGEIIKIDKPEFIIGRNKMVNGRLIKMPDGKEPDISISVKSISHIHAKFLWHDQQWFIRDLKSLNGTSVNGKRLVDNEEIALNEGDNICFASEEYEFIFVK